MGLLVALWKQIGILANVWRTAKGSNQPTTPRYPSAPRSHTPLDTAAPFTSHTCPHIHHSMFAILLCVCVCVLDEMQIEYATHTTATVARRTRQQWGTVNTHSYAYVYYVVHVGVRVHHTNAPHPTYHSPPPICPQTFCVGRRMNCWLFACARIHFPSTSIFAPLPQRSCLGAFCFVRYHHHYEPAISISPTIMEWPAKHPFNRRMKKTNYKKNT